MHIALTISITALTTSSKESVTPSIQKGFFLLLCFLLITLFKAVSKVADSFLFVLFGFFACFVGFVDFK